MSKVTISRNKIIEVDGRPFFPIGARHIPIGIGISQLAEIGFNVVRWTAFGTDILAKESEPLLDELNGMMLNVYIYDRGDFSQDTSKRKEELTNMVKRLKDHPSLLCYEQKNEPAVTFRNHSKASASPEGMAKGSDLIRELDPDHPIRVGHMTSNLISTLKKYNKAVDIVGSNPYPIMQPDMRLFVGCRGDGRFLDSPNQTLSAVGDYTTKMMKVAEGRPVWMQVQAMPNENWFSEQHTPENKGLGIYEYQRIQPTYFQMRFMAYNAIIRGATGLEWAMYKVSTLSSGWQDICKIIGELKDINRILASETLDEDHDLEYTELGFGDWTGVEYIVKRNKEEIWILAANTQFDPCEVTFNNIQNKDNKIEVYLEGRNIKMNDKSFTDRFQPYEVHIYKL